VDAMRVRVAVLLSLAAAAAAQDPFTVPHEPFQLGEVPHAHARFTESLALCRAALEADAADVRALEHAVALLEHFGRETELIPVVKKAFGIQGLDAKRTAALYGLMGHLLVQEALSDSGGGMVVIVWAGGGRQIDRGELSKEAKDKLEQAVQYLRQAIQAYPEDSRSRDSLAHALDALDAEGNKLEVRKLQMEAAVLHEREDASAGDVPELVRTDVTADELRTRAEELEQQEHPDHAQALILRKQALVLNFCTLTIPFEYEPGLYDTVSLLASTDQLRRNLTRSFIRRAGDVDFVPPQIFGATTKKKLELIEALSRDRSAGSAAALLALLLQATRPDPVADAAFAALRDAAHPAAVEHLPRLLETCMHKDGDRVVPAWAGHRLVDLAAAWKVRAAAPVLVRMLPRDDDLMTPLGTAAALGELGGPENAPALLAVAQDPGADIWFRREAVLALGRLAPEKLDAVPPEPALEIAVAAARHRVAPSETTLGRILNGLASEHEADDAARYCVDLDLRAAVPSLESALSSRKDHYAAPILAEALAELTARMKGAATGG